MSTNNSRPLSVLGVEDDPVWQEQILAAAKTAGWHYVQCSDLEQAREAFASRPIDIVLLDRMLGHCVEGLDLVGWLRESESSMPGIIVLSYLNSVDEQILGLESGVDDYLGKPFDSGALIARVNALNRRLNDSRLPIVVEVYGDLELDIRAERAFWRGERIDLQKKAYALLRAIAAGGDQAVDVETLWREVWTDYPGLPQQDTVMNTAISRLRKVLRQYPNAPSIVREGSGYRLVPS